ncbi:MAG: M20/M25/M40 family metallo-hydrolase [Thermoanaerobaculaceae bacterium]
MIFIRSKELLFELCGISSASGELDGLRRVAARLGEELRVRGLAVEIVEEVGSEGQPQPSLVARGPLAGERYLLLVGHMDTVLPAIPPRIEGDRLIATGGLDMKAGLVMLVGALDLLAARGQQPPQDLLLVAVPDEEVGGQISESVVRRWGSGRPGDARAGARRTSWRIGDAGGWPARNGGVAVLDVVGKAAHSGLAYWEGRSAAAAAADWAAQAQALSERGPGVTVNVVADDRRRRGLRGQPRGTPRAARVAATAQRGLRARGGRGRGAVPVDRGPGARAGGRSQRWRNGLLRRTASRRGSSEGSRFHRWTPRGRARRWSRRPSRSRGPRGWSLVVEEDRGGISFPNYLEDPGKVPLVDGLGPGGGGHAHP